MHQALHLPAQRLQIQTERAPDQTQSDHPCPSLIGHDSSLLWRPC